MNYHEWIETLVNDPELQILESEQDQILAESIREGSEVWMWKYGDEPLSQQAKYVKLKHAALNLYYSESPYLRELSKHDQYESETAETQKMAYSLNRMEENILEKQFAGEQGLTFREIATQLIAELNRNDRNRR